MDFQWLSDVHGTPSGRKPCSEDALIALLLCLVNDILEFTIHCDYLFSDHEHAKEYYHFTMAFLNNVTSLSALQKLVIGFPPIRTTLGAESRLSIPGSLRMPRLVSLDISGEIVDLEDNNTNVGDHHDLMNSSIRHLKFDDCDGELTDLNRLLKRCQKLETLHFKCHYGHQETRHEEVLRWSSIMEGLSYHHTQLQSLKLYLDEPMILSNFTALRDLHTNEVSLLDLLGAIDQKTRT